MAASSSSNSCNLNPKGIWKYHAFLSFRGEDTRNNFTDHLYAALWRKGIMTFRDNEQLEGGQVIKHELLQAIEESLCAIVILSQNYASSSWCLDELQKILECRRTLGRGVLPVFYGIDPSVVRHQTGSFAKAFRKHEERFREDKTKVQKWRHALSEVASLSGYHSKNQPETEVIEEIIRMLWRRVESHLPSYSEYGLVGIDTKLEDMYQILAIGSSEVRFVGIWGMGGIGKTTLAKFVFNQFRSYFDISCCIENVREKFSAMDGLLNLQIKLLSKLKMGNLEIDNVDQGKAAIRNLLFHRKVLLLLDDVDDIRQLEHLVGKQDWFGQGSRVIVTTRNTHLLDSHDVPFSKYEIGVLNTNESLKLFCQKAFKRNRPKEGYVELSKILVQYCQGLPLALKVLGSYLCGRDITTWEDALKKIRKDPPKDIMDTLRTSFEGLEDSEKAIFLDIACFFKGWHKNRVMQILEICGFYPKIGIEILIERSLLICKKETFMMHDLLQEMGRNIVILKSGNEIRKQSRLWSLEDIDDVLEKNTGTEFIEGIVLKTLNYKAQCDSKAFSRMCNLRVQVLLGSHLQLPLGLKCLPNSIKVLEWDEYPLQSLPIGVKLEKLVELKLRRSKIIQLWNGNQDFKILKLIDLSYSKDLIRTPNFVGVPNLESLILEGCSNLVEIHQSIGQLRKLVVLHLKDCKNLKYLPSKLETDCLKDFNLCGCSKVQNLLELLENMKENKCLVRLDLSETAIVEVPSFVGGLQNLESLSVRGCREQISKPWWKFGGYSMSMGLKLPSLSGLRMLRKLDASYCNLSGESIPDINCLPSLEILRLSGNNFSRNSILMRWKLSQFSGLSKLKVLELNNCSLNDESIPDDLNYLPSLRALALSGNNFSRNSILMRWKFSQFSGLSKLEVLELNNCSLNDESIPDDLNYMPSLRRLALSGNNFVNLPLGCISSLSCLRNLKLHSCSKLQTLPMFPPSLLQVDARNCGPITPLSETQILKLLMPDAENKFMEVIIPGNEIPPWFDKQKDVSSFWKFEFFQDSIIVDIPDFCASEWWGIVFCFIIETPNNADPDFCASEWWLNWAWDSATVEARPPDEIFSYFLAVEDYRGFNYNHQFISVMDCSNLQPSLGKVVRDGGNQLRLFFGACRSIGEDDCGELYDNLNIGTCGYRVICKNEVRRKATMSNFENIPSNSSGFKESRLTEIKDGTRGRDEFEGEDAFVSDDESKLDHNETQQKKLE